MAQYKTRCIRCKKNYVLASWRTRFPTCFECHSKEMVGEIKDPKMKKFFDIPEEFYRENSFLRDIKIKYLKYKNLTEKQVEAFKKVVEDMKNPPEKKSKKK